MTEPEQQKPDPAPRPAGRRLEWPTLWHKDQIPFPWGGATRLRRKPKPKPQASEPREQADEPERAA